MYIGLRRENRLELQIEIGDKLHLQSQLEIRAADAQVIINHGATLHAYHAEHHPYNMPTQLLQNRFLSLSQYFLLSPQTQPR